MRENERPLISVIIPVYNIMDCLERCVASVRAQTYPNLEIILVDDGSTDGTGALCDELGAKDDRIRVFHKKNGGSSSARNLGIQNANGAYLGFVDSDDYVEPRMYERLIEQIQRRSCRIAQTSRDEIDENGNRRPDVCTPPEKTMFQASDAFLRELLLHRGDCSFCTKLTDKTLFANQLFPEGRLNEDFYLLVGMLSKIDGICILPQQDYHVFYRVGSNTRKKNKGEFSRVFEDIVVNADYVEGVVEERFPSLRREAVRFGLYQRLDYLLHIPIGRMVNSDELYVSVKRHLRRKVKEICRNSYLTGKQRAYLLLLAAAPKMVRRGHAVWMRIRKK